MPMFPSFEKPAETTPSRCCGGSSQAVQISERALREAIKDNPGIKAHLALQGFPETLNAYVSFCESHQVGFVLFSRTEASLRICSALWNRDSRTETLSGHLTSSLKDVKKDQ